MSLLLAVPFQLLSITLFISDLDGNHKLELANFSGVSHYSFSPLGESIIFQEETTHWSYDHYDSDWDIYTVNLDGTNLLIYDTDLDGNNFGSTGGFYEYFICS